MNDKKTIVIILAMLYIGIIIILPLTAKKTEDKKTMQEKAQQEMIQELSPIMTQKEFIKINMAMAECEETRDEAEMNCREEKALNPLRELREKNKWSEKESMLVGMFFIGLTKINKNKLTGENAISNYNSLRNVINHHTHIRNPKS